MDDTLAAFFLPESKRSLFAGLVLQSLFLTLAPVVVDLMLCLLFLLVIGQIRVNRAHHTIIYGMPGGAGDFHLQGGRGSKFIIQIILWLDDIIAAECRETVCVIIDHNIYLMPNLSTPYYYSY